MTIAFSPDGRILAAGLQGGTIALWHLTAPAKPVLATMLMTATGDDVRSVAFSRDSALLAAGSASGTTRIWRVRDPARPTPVGAPLTGPDGRIFALAFGPADRTLAMGTGAGQLWLWDMSDMAHPQRQLAINTPGDIYVDLAFSPDGSMLASAGDDVRLWETDPAQIADRICRESGDAITEAEWRKHVADVPFQPPCPAPNP